LIQNLKEKIYFDDVKFENQEKITFDVDDLSRVSFRNTPIIKVRFGEKIRWAGKDGFRVIDEDVLRDNPT